ncbi:f-box domain containing protein [Ophiostoma piceae UAMH 11346]|uniref:F-box domain containing protein n=1 Tax=Ophiostoma piceae (strain UAMH 11346) TaxID=1262450 RepID=S3BZ37_OPHP1|nr:f-box domain containing protein [Ophiostoma piceae UAMH 11346]
MSPLDRLPNEILAMISSTDRLDTRSRFRLSQTCRRLRSNILQNNHTAFRLASVAEEFGVRLCSRRRIFHICLTLIALDSPYLAVCDSCMDIHDMNDVMGDPVKLPSIIKPEQQKLLALRPLDAPQCCSRRTVGAENTFRQVRVRAPDHLYVQLALKYKRLQDEDPRLLSSIPDCFKDCMLWGMWPMHRYATVPMPESTRTVKCFLFWEPRIVRREDGDLRYVVKTVYHQQSHIYNRDVPKKRRMPASRRFLRSRGRAPTIEYPQQPLTSKDIIPFSFCPHQTIGPRYASSPDEIAEAGNKFSRRRFMLQFQQLRQTLRQPEPSCPSSYTNNLIHQALSDPSSEKQLHTSCRHCATDIAVRSMYDGKTVQVMTWRDLGPEHSPANIYWQSQTLGPSQFFGKGPSTSYQSGYFGENRGCVGLVEFPLHHAGSVRELYESSPKGGPRDRDLAGLDARAQSPPLCAA